jgi:hypothetical protein
LIGSSSAATIKQTWAEGMRGDEDLG